MNENKVQFNLKNVHIAKLTNDATPAWGTPVAVPGAVSLSLDAEGEAYEFYADGIVYYGTNANNGYSGDLEMALIPDTIMKDIFGMTIGATSKVVTEDASAEPEHFALMFEIDGDAAENYYALYNCLATRPSIGSTTNTETKEAQTQTMSITARPLPNGLVQAHTTGDTPTAIRTGWFTSVFVEGATPPSPDPEENNGAV